jgi:hypothetical protein
MLVIVLLSWVTETGAAVTGFTVSNPVCTAIDLTANRCAIDPRFFYITDDGVTSPFLTWAQIVIDGHVRLRLTSFFENSIYYESSMTPQGLGVPCGFPNESGLGDTVGKAYPVAFEPIASTGASMGSDVANVLCPAAIPTTTSTSTSSTTSTSTSSTSSTTLPVGPCDGVSSGPTFASIDCRTRGLLAAVQTDGRLAGLQPKLVAALETATHREQEAAGKCAGGSTKRARKRLRQTVRKLTQVVHRLRSHAKRTTPPVEVREPFAVEASAIRGDTKTLQSTLVCPAGA